MAASDRDPGALVQENDSTSFASSPARDASTSALCGSEFAVAEEYVDDTKYALGEDYGTPSLGPAEVAVQLLEAATASRQESAKTVAGFYQASKYIYIYIYGISYLVALIHF